MIYDLVITTYLRCVRGAFHHHCYLCIHLWFLFARLGTGVVVLVAGLGHLLSLVLPFV